MGVEERRLLQDDRVEVGTARLVTDKVVNPFLAQLVQADCVGEGFATGLKGEFGVDRPKREPEENRQYNTQ